MRYLTNFVLLSYLIPMSLYVTLEFNKAMQMLMIGADKRMAVYDEFSGTIKQSRPKTSELNNQLGHVQYIFTDKTGTLTENLMTYVGGFVHGLVHSEPSQPGGLGRLLLQRLSRGGGGASRVGLPLHRAEGAEQPHRSVDRASRGALVSILSPWLSPFDVALSRPPIRGERGRQSAAVSSTPQSPLLRETTSMPVTTGAGPSTGLAASDGGNATHPPHNRATVTAAARNDQGDGHPYRRANSTCSNAAAGAAPPLLQPAALQSQPTDNFPPPSAASPSTAALPNHARDGEGKSPAVPYADPSPLPMLQQIHRMDEAVLETDPIYRYLRAISLCHSVVCFPIIEDSSSSTSDDPPPPPSKQQQNRETTAAASNADLGRGKDDMGHGESAVSPSAAQALWRQPVEMTTATTAAAAAAGTERRRTAGGDYRGTRRYRERPDGDGGGPALTIAASMSSIPRIRDDDAHSPSRGNFVELSNAVPAGPTSREAFEPLAIRSTADAAALSLHQSESVSPLSHPINGHDAAASTISLQRHYSIDWRDGGGGGGGADTSTVSHVRLQQHQKTSSSGNLQRLHGRTSSASWYQDRFLRQVAHARQRTSQTALSGHGRGSTFSLNPLNSMTLSAMMLSTPQQLTTNVAAQLESAIDRGNIYEGQSLDEIALVNAARENGFSLFRRTAKQLYVKALGRVQCYDIIAELEFSAQRKLMSILLQRRPDLDSEGAALSAASGAVRDFHRHPSGAAAAAGPTDSAAETASVPKPAPAPTLSPLSAAAAAAEMMPVERNETLHPADVAATAESNGTAFSSPSPPGLLLTTTPAAVNASRNSPHQHNLHHHRTSAAPQPPSSSFPARGSYLLLVKGADSSMLEIVNMGKKSNAEQRASMMKELDGMAKQGLRTLVLGERYVDEAEVRQWLPIFNEAQCSMQSRNERLHEAYAMLERDIDLVGTTAVEDKLQEGVPETLAFFLQASIVVWMLTGDKRETAVTIAHTSGLVAAEYSDYVCHLDVSDIIEAEILARQQRHQPPAARVDGVESADSCRPAANSDDCGTTREGPPAAVSSTANASPPQQKLPQVDDASANFAEQLRERMEEQLSAAEELCRLGQGEHDSNVVVVVVDGKTLDYLFDDDARAARFFRLGSKCRSAVCCRMTPLQKAKIVRTFRHNLKAVALAVGDGANDVSMIQESSIGIGIMGLEGSQAELASDYAIPKFRFLKRLLMVHGRFSIFRDAHCIVYSLYKNVIITVGMMAYQFYSACSGETLIDSWLLAMFSIFFSSLQPLLIGIFDKDVEDEVAESVPQLYPPLSREFMYFSYPYIGKWLLDGLVEGLVFFFFLIYTVGAQDDIYPYMSSAVEDYGTTFFTMMVLVVNLRVGFLVTYYMVIFAAAILIGLVMIPAVELVYSEMKNLAGSNWFVYVAEELYSRSSKFWLLLFFACGILLVLSMASNLYIQLFLPWQNAGLAMHAVRASNHRIHYRREKKLKVAEYAKLVAELQPQPQQV